MNLQRAILTALNRICGPTTHYPLPELTLLGDVNLILGPGASITLSPLREALVELESKKQVVSVCNEDQGTLWKITTAGRARLAE